MILQNIRVLHLMVCSLCLWCPHNTLLPTETLLLFSFPVQKHIKYLLSLILECNTLSVTSPSASTLKVIWSSHPDASVYVLDLRVVNSTNIAPLMVMQSAPSTQRLIQGLRPGHVYQVTLKAFELLYTPLCTVTKIALTGKKTFKNLTRYITQWNPFVE